MSWIYYSRLIPGYTEKYTDRGMRERNKLLLRRLSKDSLPFREKEKIENALIENNLPLAKMVAERFCDKNRFSYGSREDAFMDCVEAMSVYMREVEPDIIQKPGWFQTRLFSKMHAALYSKEERICIETKSEFIPFNEKDFEQEYPLKVDKELLEYIMICCTPRQREILKDFYLGDPANHIEPMDLEIIGIKHYLTRERVRQIKEKAIKLIRKYNGFPKDDFIMDEPSFPLCR